MNWEAATLSEICREGSPITYGILQPGPEIPNGVPYVRPSEIKGGEINVSAIRRTSPEIADRYKKSVIHEGDILITIVGTIGHIAIVPSDLDGGNITQSSARIRVCPSKADRDYVKHFLRSPMAVRQYEQHRLGVAVARLNLHHVRDLQIPLPPLEEQKRIAAILDAADALRAKRRESIAQLDALLQSTFLHMFGDPVTNPMGWRISTLGDECEEVKNGYSIKQNKEAGGVAISRIETIADGTVDPKRVGFAGLDLESCRDRLLKDGDVLFSHINSTQHLCKCAIYRERHGPLVHGMNLLRLRSGAQLDPLYLLYLLKSSSFRATLMRHENRAVNQSSIAAGKLKPHPLPVPPLERQQRFAALVEATETHRSLQVAHLDELDALFASLQDRAFNGELLAA